MRTLISSSFVSLDGKLDPTGGEPELRDTRWTAATVDFPVPPLPVTMCRRTPGKSGDTWKA